MAIFESYFGVTKAEISNRECSQLSIFRVLCPVSQRIFFLVWALRSHSCYQEFIYSYLDIKIFRSSSDDIENMIRDGLLMVLSTILILDS